MAKDWALVGHLTGHRPAFRSFPLLAAAFRSVRPNRRGCLPRRAIGPAIANQSGGSFPTTPASRDSGFSFFFFGFDDDPLAGVRVAVSGERIGFEFFLTRLNIHLLLSGENRTRPARIEWREERGGFGSGRDWYDPKNCTLLF